MNRDSPSSVIPSSAAGTVLQFAGCFVALGGAILGGSALLFLQRPDWGMALLGALVFFHGIAMFACGEVANAVIAIARRGPES